MKRIVTAAMCMTIMAGCGPRLNDEKFALIESQAMHRVMMSIALESENLDFDTGIWEPAAEELDSLISYSIEKTCADNQVDASDFYRKARQMDRNITAEMADAVGESLDTWINAIIAELVVLTISPQTQGLENEELDPIYDSMYVDQMRKLCQIRGYTPPGD